MHAAAGCMWAICTMAVQMFPPCENFTPWNLC